ncbi:MAG: electron transport complex subunit E [Deltaproteobacteria bacterium]|nr:electron transport complex subunit E [Deltaproteobacteria bacterium]
MSEYGKIMKKGLWTENPVFKQLLGMCPLLAVTTSAENGLGMGLASTFVLVCANIVVSVFREYIPAKVRIPCFIVIIASFVTITDLVMAGFMFDLHKKLGLFIPLIVANCMILGRAEGFASKHSIDKSIVDGVAVGLGFTLALVILGGVRELFGNGTVFSVNIFGDGYLPLIVMVLPPGAFIALGFIIAFFNKLEKRA